MITVVQCLDNDSCRHRHCYCTCICWWRSSRIFHFSRWLDQLNTFLTKDERQHAGYTFTPWVVYFTPPGTITILGIQPKQPGMCSVSKPSTQLGLPIQVLALPDDHLTSREHPCSWPQHYWDIYPSLWYDTIYHILSLDVPRNVMWNCDAGKYHKKTMSHTLIYRCGSERHQSRG